MGYEFSKWRYESPSGRDYAEGETITINPEVSSPKTTYNMYAIWEKSN